MGEEHEASIPAFLNQSRRESTDTSYLHSQPKKKKYPRAGFLTHNPAKHLVETLGGAHGSLEGEGADVLPALLEEGDEVVDGQHDVANKLLIGHVDVADSDTHAENLLELELDGGLDVGDLGGEVLVVGNRGGELTGCERESVDCARLIESGSARLTLGKTGTQQTRNLLDEGVGSDEGVVLAGQLLDELLVLVELLQVLGGHGVNTTVLGTVDIVLVTENADGHVGARDTGKLDGARETLVTLGVVVLEADLELDGLEEVALLLLVGVLEQLLHILTHASDRDLGHDCGVGLPITSRGRLMVRLGVSLVVEEEDRGRARVDKFEFFEGRVGIPPRSQIALACSSDWWRLKAGTSGWCINS